VKGSPDHTLKVAASVVRKRDGEGAKNLAASLEELRELFKSDPEPLDSKNPAAVALGRLGGKKGGKARAAKMTAKERSEAARKAAKARWLIRTDSRPGRYKP